MEESLTKSGKADDPVLSVNIASLPRPGGGEMLSGIHFSAGKGECLAVIGPNGSGKTTLLRAIDCQLPSREGDVRLYGRSIAALTRQQRARQIAVLAQNDTPDLRLALEDYVALGRIPHARDMSRREHDIIVTRAINCASDRSPRYPVVRDNGRRWRGYWPRRQNCCCWMSPPTTLIPTAEWSCCH